MSFGRGVFSRIVCRQGSCLDADTDTGSSLADTAGKEAVAAEVVAETALASAGGSDVARTMAPEDNSYGTLEVPC